MVTSAVPSSIVDGASNCMEVHLEPLIQDPTRTASSPLSPVRTGAQAATHVSWLIGPGERAAAPCHEAVLPSPTGPYLRLFSASG
jgi:hypothetical protein